jgi:hypothetical protein
MSFRYSDNLSSILKASTINPYREKTPYDSFDDYIYGKNDEEKYDYEIISPKNKQISSPIREAINESIKNSNNPTANNYMTLSTIFTNPEITTVENIENIKHNPNSENSPNESNNNDEESKHFETANIGLTNTIYIGSITILGLYILYRYMHASK